MPTFLFTFNFDWHQRQNIKYKRQAKIFFIVKKVTNSFHNFSFFTSCEGAQRLRVECSPFLKLVNMDVTRDDHVQHAINYIIENLPVGEQGMWNLKLQNVYFWLGNEICRPFRMVYGKKYFLYISDKKIKIFRRNLLIVSLTFKDSMCIANLCGLVKPNKFQKNPLQSPKQMNRRLSRFRIQDFHAAPNLFRLIWCMVISIRMFN